MKKMMMIAVIISGMLMPAQVFAKNDRNECRGADRVLVDHNRVVNAGNKKPVNIAKNNSHVDNKKHYKNNNNPVEVKPSKPAPVIVHKPKPAPEMIHLPEPASVVVHHPAPAPVTHNHCDGDVAAAAVVAIGIAGLVSILAN